MFSFDMDIFNKKVRQGLWKKLSFWERVKEREFTFIDIKRQLV